MLGGWGSDLLDRLGMHYWTASGSVRGVVDFIRAGEARYNVADLFIVGATPLLLLAVGFLSWRAADRPDTLRAAGRAPSPAGTDAGAGRRRPYRARCRAWRGKLRRGEDCPRARQPPGGLACALSRGRVVPRRFEAP